MQTVSLTKMQIISSFQRYEIVYIVLDIVCTVQVVDFIIFFKQMHNVFKYLFRIALLHVPMFTHHPQGISYVC